MTLKKKIEKRMQKLLEDLRACPPLTEIDKKTNTVRYLNIPNIYLEKEASKLIEEYVRYRIALTKKPKSNLFPRRIECFR